jgi:lipoprotein NlpD
VEWGRGVCKLYILLLAGVALAGCSSFQTHTVRRGETLSEIAERYNTSSQELARRNRLLDPNQIEIGQRLELPRRSTRSRRTAEVKSERRPAASQKRSARKSNPEKRSLARVSPDDVPGDIRPFPQEREPREGAAFSRWPIAGRLTSRFGPRGGSFHDGIDISAPKGTAIIAVADGEVIFSSALHGYGNIVILRHRNGLVTVYAHNHRNLVAEGEWVRRGRVIAEVGQTGRASGPHLHFEVRKDNQARNPLRYLPEDTQTASRNR